MDTVLNSQTVGITHIHPLTNGPRKRVPSTQWNISATEGNEVLIHATAWTDPESTLSESSQTPRSLLQDSFDITVHRGRLGILVAVSPKGREEEEIGNGYGISLGGDGNVLELDDVNTT